MKFLVASLIIIAVAIAAAFFIHIDAGQVDIVFQGLHYSTSLAIALSILAVAFIGFYIVLRLILGLLNAPKKLKKRSLRKREEKSHLALSEGLVKFAEGEYEGSEALLLNNMSGNKQCDLANYLTAAQSAGQRQQFDLSKEYVDKAAAISAEAEVPAALVEAKMLMERKAYRDAIRVLTEVRKKAPNNTLAIWLLGQSYGAIRNWESMTDMAKLARRKQAAPREDVLEMETTAALGALNDCAEGNVVDVFERQASHIQELSAVVLAYVKRLNDMGKPDEANKIAAKSLETNWDEALAAYYGSIESADAAGQLAQLEKWLKSNGESASLLLAKGKIVYRSGEYQDARDALVKSIGISPSREAFFTLGKTLEALGDKEGAIESYKHGYAVEQLRPVTEVKVSESSKADA
ncbi:heme biosynthesis HemY N-terminal domain-containing protein [Granulosicoccaceae sp. 1_MG-2023]|nr:heme biosynthesis HemY N-terminal domain-containing protein [Granulosicoccaceae sp. 1_MG-2023]